MSGLVQAWAIVGPDGEIDADSVRATESFAWVQFCTVDRKSEMVSRGYTCQPVTITPGGTEAGQNAAPQESNKADTASSTALFAPSRGGLPKHSGSPSVAGPVPPPSRRRGQATADT